MNAKKITLGDSKPKMTPYEFEKAVASYFLEKGYTCEERGGSYDKGVDLIAEKNREKIAIQIKMYDQRMVNYKDIMYLFAAQNLFQCEKSILLTSGLVRQDAKKIAKDLKVKIIENWYPNKTFSIAKNNFENFSQFWEDEISSLKTKTIKTVTGKKNQIIDVSFDGIKRKTSNGKISFVKIEIFKGVYETLIKENEISREEINHLYPGRVSSFIVAVFSNTKNFTISKDPIKLVKKSGS